MSEPVRREQDVERAPRRRTSHRSRAPRRRRRSRLRAAYFALAAAWGFLAGTTAVLGILVVRGRPLALEPAVAVVLLLAASAALLGGVVAARAYRETADRP